ncbi:MAG: CarboxypepD reg-like domain, partial [Bacteroidetes bacterium]|nr:CarboxypepD reg-like domain [Bacteroidota bacterium]
MRNLNLLITEILFLFLISSCTITDVNEPVTISGKITDSSGSGLSDVKILLETSSEKINAQTSSDGKYTLVIPNGGVAFATFSKEGYTSETKSIAFKGGENRAINLSMNTLKEDAYFRIITSDVSVKNRRGSFSVLIDTNVKYEFSCKEDWIKCEILSNNIYIEYDENKTLEKRTATINFNADFGLTHTIKITQEAGPILQLIDYIGKDNQTNFLTSVPFITFNREVKLVSISSSYQDIDLTAEYSADKKTIYFPNIKIPPFISTTITYEVESTDSAKIKESFKLKVYEGKLDITTGNGQKIIFT